MCLKGKSHGRMTDRVSLETGMPPVFGKEKKMSDALYLNDEALISCQCDDPAEYTGSLSPLSASAHPP